MTPAVTIRQQDLLSSFRRHLRAADKAPRTIELYSQSVRYFSNWLVPRGRPATLDELTGHVISAWLAGLAKKCEPSTVATRLRGMRRFCRWLVTEDELDKAPTDGIETATAPDKPVPILTDEEITALLKTCAVGRGRPGVSPGRSSSDGETRRSCGCGSTPASASPSCVAWSWTTSTWNARSLGCAAGGAPSSYTPGSPGGRPSRNGRWHSPTSSRRSPRAAGPGSVAPPTEVNPHHHTPADASMSAN
jgi:hypothetical protein